MPCAQDKACIGASLWPLDLTRPPFRWTDQCSCVPATADQNNIQQSLSFLPIYLSGCQTLLIMAGPTYCSRLWCVMEIFTFLFMGGKLERIEIHALSASDDAPTSPADGRRSSLSSLKQQFATFDAAKAIKAYQKQMDATHEKIDDAAKKRRERLTARLAKAPAKLPPMDGAAAHAPGSAVGLYKSNHR